MTLLNYLLCPFKEKEGKSLGFYHLQKSLFDFGQSPWSQMASYLGRLITLNNLLIRSPVDNLMYYIIC